MRKRIITQLDYDPASYRTKEMDSVSMVNPTPYIGIAETLERLQSGMPLTGAIDFNAMKWFGDIGQSGINPASLDIVDRLALHKHAERVIERVRDEHLRNKAEAKAKAAQDELDRIKAEEQRMADLIAKQKQNI